MTHNRGFPVYHLQLKLLGILLMSSTVASNSINFFTFNPITPVINDQVLDQICISLEEYQPTCGWELIMTSSLELTSISAWGYDDIRVDSYTFYLENMPWNSDLVSSPMGCMSVTLEGPFGNEIPSITVACHCVCDVSTDGECELVPAFQDTELALSEYTTPTAVPTERTTDPFTGTATHPITGTATHPKTGTATYPITGTATHPKTGTATHPITGTATYPITGTATHPITGTATHPFTGTVTQPKTGTATYPKTGTATYPITETATNPITGTATHPVTDTSMKPTTIVPPQATITSSKGVHHATLQARLLKQGTLCYTGSYLLTKLNVRYFVDCSVMCTLHPSCLGLNFWLTDRKCDLVFEDITVNPGTLGTLVGCQLWKVG